MMKLYGIKNCGTVKKAIDWLNSRDTSFEFHDYKSKGISEKKLQEWNEQVDLNSLINRKGTTWRKLDETLKNKLENEAMDLGIIAANTSLLKRPIIERDVIIITVGFDEKEFSKNY